MNNNTPLEVVAKSPVPPEFKWEILWEFLKPQVFALIGAVVVSLNKFENYYITHAIYTNQLNRVIFLSACFWCSYFEHSNPLDAWGPGEYCCSFPQRTHWELRP